MMTTEAEETPTIPFTHFEKPKGRRKELTMSNIRPEAAKYINENNIKVSTETGLGSDMIVYFDDGTTLDDDVTPDEIIIISHGRSCKDVMDEGVEKIKKRAGK